MKKIPTLFKMEYLSKSERMATRKVTPGMEWVLDGKGTATIKCDGAACAMIGGRLYKRFDATPGKKIPDGAIPCIPEADPITGHFPHWVPVSKTDPADKWFRNALEYTHELVLKCDERIHVCPLQQGKEIKTFEAVGPHFNGNHDKELLDHLVPHGSFEVLVSDRSYEGIRKWLAEHKHEGLVFWKDGEPQCKIRRRDFGLDWPITKSEQK